jgi:hypothetical protein
MKTLNLFNAHNISGKSTNSNLNSQVKQSKWTEFLKKSSREFKFLIAFLALIYSNPLGYFDVDIHKNFGREKINIEIRKDSTFNVDYSRSTESDTTKIKLHQRKS